MNYPGFQTYQYVAKKYVFDILQDRYAQNEATVTRLTHYLATEQEVRDFVKLVVDSYERGYMKAVDDYRGKLRQLGYDVKVVEEKKI